MEGSSELVPTRAIIYLPSIWSLSDTSPQAAAPTWLQRPPCEYQPPPTPTAPAPPPPRCHRPRSPLATPSPGLPASPALPSPWVRRPGGFWSLFRVLLLLLPPSARLSGDAGCCAVLGNLGFSPWFWGSVHLSCFALPTSLSSGWAAWVSTMLWAPTLSLGITLDNPSAARSGACGGCQGLFPPWFGPQDPTPLEMLPKRCYPLPSQKTEGAQRALPPPCALQSQGETCRSIPYPS